MFGMYTHSYFDNVFANVRIYIKNFMITMHLFTLITLNETIDHEID